MRALCDGVNTSVGSSSTMNAHSDAGDTFKGVLKMILYRFAMRLTLPAGEPRAVVSGGQFQSSRLVGTPRRGARSAQRANPTHVPITDHQSRSAYRFFVRAA